MFEHSIKVPRHFKISANIVKKVATEGGSVKNLLYDSKLRFFRTNVIYALITETIKHSGDIDKLFEATGLLSKEPRLDPWLAKVITTELIFGKKELPGHSKPEQTILNYKEQFEKVPLQPIDVKSEVRRPRYVRVNTNLLTTSDAIGAFQDEGYKFIRCTSGSYKDYLKQIQGLSEYDFTQDYHVKTMFVFHPNTKFHDHDLYLENKIILQDKATALPVHLLAPPQGSVILDMCAAPGIKTTQMAAYIRNQGKIYAVERNEQRYQTLCDFVQRTDSKCVATMHRDSLDIKKGECDDVEYIILDPSCSGSGMQLSVHNYVEDVRLARLTSLQEKFLKHAMNSFPKAKKIVYSTCSIFPQENERVISNVVKSSRAKWKVLNVKDLLKGHWNNFGSGMYGEMGTRCLYARPDSDLTTGFFLAVLERDPKKENEEVHNKVKIEKKNKQGKAEKEISKILEYSDSKNNIDISENDESYQNPKQENGVDEEFDNKVKRKKNNKKKRNVEEVIQLDQLDTNKDENDTPEQHKTKKNKKHKKDVGSESNVIYETDSKSQNEVSEELKKSKRKKGAENDLSPAMSIDSAVNNIGDSVVDKKKECKKKKADIDQNEECNIQDGVENSVKEFKKSKKQKLKHQSVDAVYEDNCEPVKKEKEETE